MKLVSAEVQGFRRFVDAQKLNLEGPVVALVGPNEAGKTSLLRALVSLENTDPYEKGTWPRGSAAPDDWVVRTTYRIEPEDRDAIGDVVGVTDVRWYVYWKKPDGSRAHSFEPRSAIRRDRSPRQSALAHIEKALIHKTLAADEGFAHDARIALSDITGILRSTVETLSGDHVAQIVAASEALDEVLWDARTPKYLAALADELRDLAEHEAEKHPADRALKVLDSRHGRFLMFGDADRDLLPSYELGEVVAETPRSLANLVELAELDIEALSAAQLAEEHTTVEYLLEEANQTLRRAFLESWRQSEIYPRIRLDGSVLHVMISAIGPGYTNVEERSDGFLAFVALWIFTALRSNRTAPVILLVDEAETHLHYDAQADIVRVFTEQRAAEKVIFTTHSAGCLPNDLAAVRQVRALDNGRSELVNAYWSDGPGLSPMLTAMGASVMAFTPARRAVFVEGGADVILLPAILREAAEKADLEFQVVPGLAEAKPDEIPNLDLEAAAVAFLVDGDSAGAKLKGRLSRHGVPERLVVQLGGPDSGLVVEDLLDSDLYAAAIRAVMGPREKELRAVDLGNVNRPAALRRWCKRVQSQEPNKVAIGYAVLAQLEDGGRLLDPAQAETAKALYGQLATLVRVGADLDRRSGARG